jgi:glycine betaine/proline transport system ATP-binding protein
MTAAILFKDVDILFAKGSGRARAQATAKALALEAEGADRSKIAAETGVVLGVAGANLTVKSGEICVLMGLSGSGKSTLMRAANGLNPVTRGQVLVRHMGGTVDVAKCDSATLRAVRRRSVAMVFQQFALLPWRTVRENVGLGLEFQGMDKTQRRQKVDEKLALVGLSEWADRKTQDLSGGMQQRVGLARAFATEADILLMDEPFSALDPLIRSRLQDELISLQDRVQKTILFVSHDLDEALKLGDQISIMEGGRIVQTGTGEDIVSRPADDYVAQFVRHMNPLSVLTGATAMRSLSDILGDRGTASGMVWRDGRLSYKVNLDSDRCATTAWFDDAHLPLKPCQDGTEAIGPSAMVVASVQTPLAVIVRMVHASGHAVLLTDNGQVTGQVCGVCGHGEILKALSRA